MGVDPVGVDEGEFAEGGFPALGEGAFDEPGGGLAWPCGILSAISLARSLARLSSMFMMASQSSLIAASSLGKWPRFLMILRSW